MTTANPLKRKEFTDDAGTWSCPVCLSSPHDASGVVPMASTSCGAAAAHMMCLACFQQLPRHKTSGGTEYVDCPTCRTRTNFLVLLPLVDAWGDDSAINASAAYQASIRSKRAVVQDVDDLVDEYEVQAAQERAFALENQRVRELPASARSMALAAAPTLVSLSDDERQERRLVLAIEAIQRQLNRWQGNQPHMVYYDTVPEWDRDCVRLVCRMAGMPALSRVQLCDKLNAISRALLPRLRETFAESGIVISLPGAPARTLSIKHGDLLYLAFIVTKETPEELDEPQARSVKVDRAAITSAQAPVPRSVVSTPATIATASNATHPLQTKQISSALPASAAPVLSQQSLAGDTLPSSIPMSLFIPAFFETVEDENRWWFEHMSEIDPGAEN